MDEDITNVVWYRGGLEAWQVAGLPQGGSGTARVVSAARKHQGVSRE